MNRRSISVAAALASPLAGAAAAVYVYFGPYFTFSSSATTGSVSKGLLEYDPESGLVTLVAFLLALSIVVGVVGLAHAVSGNALARWVLAATAAILMLVTMVVGWSVGGYFFSVR